MPFDPQPHTPGIGRADVWVFDAAATGDALGGEPLTILSLFGDTLRPLAVSPDGSRVYAGVFNSGNRTTIVHADIGGGGLEKPGPQADAAELGENNKVNLVKHCLHRHQLWREPGP